MIFTVIGTGNMGRALVGGFIKSGILTPKDVRLCDIDEKKVTELASETGCQPYTDASKAVASYRILAEYGFKIFYRSCNGCGRFWFLEKYHHCLC